ncbi:MAG: hypothetical protein ACWGQW_00960 [bacterium]
MATIWTGEWPQKNYDYGGAVSRGIQAGLGPGVNVGVAKSQNQQRMEQGALASAIEMYRSASPEDRKVLMQAPGWQKNIVPLARKYGYPVNADGSFVVPEPTGEQLEKRSLEKFPGRSIGFAGSKEYGQVPPIEVPAGYAGGKMMMEANKAALESAMTGQTALRGAQAHSITEGLKLEEERNKIERDKITFAYDELKKKEAYWKGQNAADMLRALAGTGSPAGRMSPREEEDFKQLDTFNKTMDKLGEDLRQKGKFADRTEVIRQAIARYHSFMQTVDPSNTAMVSGATVPIVELMVQELTIGSFHKGHGELGADQKVAEAIKQNYLDMVSSFILLPENLSEEEVAKMSPEEKRRYLLVPEPIRRAMRNVMNQAGYVIDSDPRTGRPRFVTPKTGGGGIYDALFGG